MELAFAYFNLFGVHELVDFILGWRPPEVVYRIARKFIRRLIDAGDFNAVDEISRIGSRSQYLMIALTRELLEVGRFPCIEAAQMCLDLLTTNRIRIPKPGYSYNDTRTEAIVSFTEACVARDLSRAKILRVLRHYISDKTSRSVSSRFPGGERDTYLRAIALRCVLSGNLEPDLEKLLPEKARERATV